MKHIVQFSGGKDSTCMLLMMLEKGMQVDEIRFIPRKNISLEKIVAQAKKDTPILISALLALTFSCLFTWVPGLKEVSGGLAIVICTVAAAAICAALFPVGDEEVAQ